MNKEKREEIREQIKGGKMFFNTELLQALDTIDLLESHLSKARETLAKYADENSWDNTSFMHKNAFAYEMGYEPAQQCLAEIGGEDA